MYYVYGKHGCAYCISALNLLNSQRLKYEYLEIDSNPTFVDFLKRTFHCKTYPMIFYDGNYIGGFQQLQNSLQF